MRVAFYAPLKPPTAAIPSGDRHMARQLMAALRAAGHTVELASRFRSWDGAGDAARQARLQGLGERLAARYVARMRAAPAARRPELWFTYHLYHKAPDWIGPTVARALGIPYVVAEASYAPKQAGGKWAAGHAAAGAAIAAARAVIGLNSNDAACVRPLLGADARLFQIKPFSEIGALLAAAQDRPARRRALTARYGLDPERPTLLAVGMMRPGDKVASYEVLAGALRILRGEDWQLLIVGDGAARAAVGASFAEFGGDRVRFAGAVKAEALPEIFAGADIYVWPAIREAYGIALLEAQAAGLPAVAGRTGGVPDIVDDGVTGLLAEPGSEADFAAKLRSLLRDRTRAAAMGARAAEHTARDHSLQAASVLIDGAVRYAAQGGGA